MSTKAVTLTKLKVHPMNTTRANAPYDYLLFTTDGNPTVMVSAFVEKFSYSVIVSPSSLSVIFKKDKKQLIASNTPLHIVSEFPTDKNIVPSHHGLHCIEC